MKIGFHISVAGGFKNVIKRARERSCSTIQIFSRNPRAWRFNPLDEDDINAFKEALKSTDIEPVFVHMPYLVNLATPDRKLFKKSKDSLVVELQRAANIGAQYVIMHIGSSKDVEEGIGRMIKGINQALNHIVNRVMLLLENTPKSGNEIGYNFDQIKSILNGIEQKHRIGLVLDTAHAFAAGYPLNTKIGVMQTLSDLDRNVGIDKLHLVHFNDSKTPCGSRHDRHWHIGVGNIGKGMDYIINHPLLRSKPFILETPRKSLQDDLDNLAMVRKYLKIISKT